MPESELFEPKADINERRFKRPEAAAYTQEHYKFGSKREFEKAAVTGDGPRYFKVGRTVIYTQSELDKWALAKLGEAHASTAEHEAHSLAAEPVITGPPRPTPTTASTVAKPVAAPVVARRAGRKQQVA
jgi:hypothetical protein